MKSCHDSWLATKDENGSFGKVSDRSRVGLGQRPSPNGGGGYFRGSDTNWADAVAVTVPFTASTPGITEWLTAPVSYTGGTAYFALKSQNAEGNWSDLSNNAFWSRFDVYLPPVMRADGL